MAKTVFLTFYICERDPDQVATNQATQWVPAVNLPDDGGIQTTPLPAGLVNRAPLGAEVEFDAPFRGYTQPVDVDGDFIYTPWSGAAEEDGPFPLNVATFTRKTGGFWGFGGTTTKYYWLGQFVYVPPSTPQTGPGVPATPANLAEVRWMDGFELPDNGEGGSTAAAAFNVSPDASRHLDGLGWSYRHNTGTLVKRHDWDETGAANPAQAWSRIYIRLRRLPDGQGMFWSCDTTTSATQSVVLKMMPSGAIALFAPVSTVLTLRTTSTFVFEVGRWYRLDMLMKCGANTPNDGRFRLFVDGDFDNAVFDEDFTTSEGLGGGGVTPALNGVQVGGSESNNGLEMDFDDWTGCSIPNGVDPAFTGRDWLNGSRVILVRPSALQTSTNWTGNVRALWQRVFGLASTSALTSSTSGATLAVDLEYDNERRAPGALGTLAINPFVRMLRASATAAQQLGYALDGSTYVNANKTATTTELWFNSCISLHAGGANPTAITTLRVQLIHSADTVAITVRALGATALLYGVFGPEDVPPWSDLADEAEDGDFIPPEDVATPAGIHNWPYPHSPWALKGAAPPLSPVYFKTGSYTGNDTAQDLTFPVPIHFFWARPSSTTPAGGVQWIASALGAHTALDEGIRPGAVVRAHQNLAYDGSDAEDAQQEEYVVSISGTDTQANANGVTYQYLAISDPGGRLLLCENFRHGAVPTSFANALADSGFLPALGIFQVEDIATTATDRTAWKGPGHAADGWQIISGSETATSMTFAEGVITSGTTVHGLDQGNGISAALFRRDDGILDSDGDSQDGQCWQMFSYVGDGAASRTLPFPVAVGRRPLWAIIGPTNGLAYMRDPANTTNTSNQVSAGTSTATGITAGAVDTITVGTTLNSNGVTYNVFFLVGSATAGNGGWSVDGTYTPVEPDVAPGTQWGPEQFPGDPTTAPEEEEEDDPDPNDPDALTTDIAANCLAASTRLCNRALSRLGITARIESLATDDTVEADQFRLIYKGEIDAVLRAYPWQFATAYADVVHEDGVDADDPVTGDWVHSYRQPSDCLFVRRIVRPDLQRTYDADPPAFRSFADDDRQLFYSNEPGQKIELDDTWADETEYTFEIEYTRRVDCPASRGDAIFRSCAAWRLAAAVAVALGKDAKEFDRCMKMFAFELPKAEVVTAREQQPQDKGTGDPDWIAGR